MGATKPSWPVSSRLSLIKVADQAPGPCETAAGLGFGASSLSHTHARATHIRTARAMSPSRFQPGGSSLGDLGITLQVGASSAFRNQARAVMTR